MVDVLKKNAANCNYNGLPIVDEEIKQHLEALSENYWDFVAYSKQYTHNIHNYPAMMIPPIPQNLISMIKTYQPNIKNLMDPFMGSGTVLLEGLLAGMNVWGLDLNPLACLITRAKCRPIDPEILQKTSKLLLKNIALDIRGNLEAAKPEFYNNDYWFKDYVSKHLQIVKQRIKEIADEKIRVFYWVVFSETVRGCSNTRHNEFKLYRIPEKKLSAFNPSVRDVFETNLRKNEQGMAELYENYRGGSSVEILAADTRNFYLDKKMDLVITSPPYGDSRTTVAYGQFSRLSLQWLDLEDYNYVSNQIEKNRLDKYLLGGKNNTTENNLSSASLRNTLREISRVDRKRALDVLSFYIDLDKCLENITKQAKVNSYQFWVVGNRTVKKVNLPTNIIISELGARYNLKTIAVIPRNISSKRMPKENSPTNIRGKKVTTMNRENIVILRKIL